MILDLLTETVYQRVIAGTLVIGCTCGVLGTFTYLRRQSLIADVIGHSSMLGVTLAFLVSVTLLGIDGRTILVIVLVSAIVGVLSALLTSRIADTSRVGPDAAMAVVLAVTFGGGMALLAEINSRSFPSSRAGLKDYLFGNASTVTWSDIRVSAAFAGAALAALLLLWRDVQLFVFDPDAARVLGRPIGLVEVTVTAATVVAVVIGLKSVGLVLVIAYVVFPAVAARATRKDYSYQPVSPSPSSSEPYFASHSACSLRRQRRSSCHSGYIHLGNRTGIKPNTPTTNDTPATNTQRFRSTPPPEVPGSRTIPHPTDTKKHQQQARSLQWCCGLN